MLTQGERKIVEAIKECPTVIVRAYDGYGTEINVRMSTKKGRHDVALAVQSYFLNKEDK